VGPRSYFPTSAHCGATLPPASTKKTPTGMNGVTMSKTKAPDTYQLVFYGPGKKKEDVLFTSQKLLDVELKREQHIRSITSGYVEIRKA
jgi:hypothetical protein